MRSQAIIISKEIISNGLDYFAKLTGQRLVSNICEKGVETILIKHPLVFEELYIKHRSGIHIRVRDNVSDAEFNTAFLDLFEILGESFSNFIGPVGRRYFILGYQDYVKEHGEIENHFDFLPEWLQENLR